MAAIKGTNVIAPVVPFDTADVHPSHEARYGKGGYRTVATLAERDAIPAPRREAGMLVFVTADEKTYQLGGDLSTWSEFKSVASTWDGLAGKPSTFHPSAHGHTIGDVTGLQTALDAKATPADVTAAVAAVVDAAPASLDTLNELAAALGDDANFAATVTNALAAKAPLANPTFTGTVSGVTKAMVGLGNADNTSDANKPVSTAQAAADSAVSSAAAADATTKANAAQAAAVQRANHTGTQAIATVDGLQSALDGKQPTGSYIVTSDSRLTDSREWSADTITQAEAEAGTATTRRAFTALRVFQAIAAWWNASAAKTKLDGIATGATANATDAQLRDRATHTGQQAISTISATGTPSASTFLRGDGAWATAGVADGNKGDITVSSNGSAWTINAGAVVTADLADSAVTTAKLADGSVTDAKITSGGLSTSSLNWAAIQPWAANTAYAKGDLVSFDGIAYRRSAAGTSGSTFNSANWQQITPSSFVASQIASGTLDVSRIPSLPASQITSGVLAAARLGTGTADATTFLRGDGTFASPTASITYATLAQAQNAVSTAASNPLRVRDQLAKWKMLDLNQLIATTASSGSIFAYNNTYQMNSNATANGSVVARIQNDFGNVLGYSSVANIFQGAGTTFWSRPQAFAFRGNMASASANGVIRIQFGKSQATATVGRMANAGVGVEFQRIDSNTTRVLLLVHNGTTLSAVNTGFVVYLGTNYDYVISSDAAGNVSLLFNDSTFSTTGGPTTGALSGITLETLNGGDATNTGLSIYRYLFFTGLS